MSIDSYEEDIGRDMSIFLSVEVHFLSLNIFSTGKEEECMMIGSSIE
jgi:hypothetical protein